jgi:hypothetical protein
VRGYWPTAIGRDDLFRFERAGRHHLEAQRLVETRLDLFAVFDRATEISRVYTSRLLCRSLDILHVAAAMAVGRPRFFSGDDRQLVLAQAVGLELSDRKRARQRRG